MKGKSLAKTDGKIFIGHGQSKDWLEVASFLRERLDLKYEEFNRVSVAGVSTRLGCQK